MAVVPVYVRKADGTTYQIGSLDPTKVSKTGDTMTGTLVVPRTDVNAAAGTTRYIYSTTAGSIRWAAGANSTAEAGSNAGSNYVIARYSDAGTLLENALTITRSTGQVTVANDLYIDNYYSLRADYISGAHVSVPAFNNGLSLANNKIIQMADPTAVDDGANKRYVDNSIVGFKAPCRVVSTTNQATLSGLLTIDGITLVANDRVLLAAQTTTSQNGIYLAASGAWTRATDADSNGEIVDGSLLVVSAGTTNADTVWQCTATGATPWVPGSSSSTWSKFSSGGGGTTRTITSISGATTAGSAASTDYVYKCTAALTLTMPTAVGNTNRYTIKNFAAATISVATTSSQTIDGVAAPFSITTQYQSIDLISDNANWMIV